MTTLIKSPNPIRTVYLHIRSKDAQQLTAGYNTDMYIDLLQAIQADSDEVIDVAMVSAAIPHSFYCISSDLGNDTIIYDTNQTLTLDTQNYDPYELVRMINADAPFNAIFTASYNIYTNKMTFTNTTGDNHDLNWTTSGANNPLGFTDAADVTVAGGGTSISPDMLDLATIHSIIIRSDMAQGNVLTTESGGIGILQKINIDVDPLSIIYMNSTDRGTVSLSHAPAIDRIHFRFEDQNFKLLQLNNRNFEFSVRFHIHQLIPKIEVTKESLVQPAKPVEAVPNPNQTIGEAISGVNEFVEPVPIHVAINETILDSLLG